MAQAAAIAVDAKRVRSKSFIVTNVKLIVMLGDQSRMVMDDERTPITRRCLALLIHFAFNM